MNRLPLTAQQLTGQAQSHLVQLDSGELLQAEAAHAWQQLCQRAARDGIELAAVSSFRSFERQALIWQQKCSGARPVLDQQQQALAIEQLVGWEKLEAILLYSALPGASRHHWGTELDVIDKAALPADYQLQLVPAEYQAGGVFAHLGHWLTQHATDAGFFLPYRQYRGGVAAEPWHLSYQPLAERCLAQFTVEMLHQALLAQPIAEQQLVLANLPQIYQRYVLTICEAES
ncbi:M15 family metallopeptidase [Alkalimonas amylolytica]|uniref:LD-carboxypeptidase LdcB, LAS superfamily n=1 Tax=Alkalimonas amylolytica TaxID=152573 RepID=A0A1H4AZM8_ALKAM|nr:M15 family metallopeptidase [Alkalimonas amylolytica]SEA41264.1 LD-carboxypeptidase LdcB, LAS superfamily [Alkalimonas amylolytica]